MAEHQECYSLEVMSRVLKVSRSGYYAWLSRPPCKRRLDDEVLLKAIEKIFRESDGIYGSPNILNALCRSGYRVSKKRVERLMQENRIKSCYNAVRKPRTTNSRHDNPVSPNLLKRQFKASRPNQVWVSDITYIPSRKGWVYMCQIKDLYSAMIVGWSVSYSLETDFVIEALLSAIRRREPGKNLIFHSDRGVQYTSAAFRKLLIDHGMRSSMSRKGDCYDNAPAESFFATLKIERVNRRVYSDIEEVKKDLFEYIEIFYNRKRFHSANDGLSPFEFENKNAA